MIGQGHRMRAGSLNASPWLGLAALGFVACGADAGSADPEEGFVATTDPSLFTAEQGCDSNRLAVAYRATADGSKALDKLPAAARNPVPCLSLTGAGANEPALGIARNGTVYFSPATTADGNGLLSSSDLGVTWKLIVPPIPGRSGHPRLQPFFYLDPATDRLFYASSKLVLNGLGTFKDEPGIHLNMSSDGGATWKYQSIAETCRDWEKIFAGPPVTSDTGAYPHVTYVSVPSPIAGNWAGIYPAPDYQHIFKSLDGGETYTEVSRIVIDPLKVAGCIAGDFIMMGQGSVGPDGTVYLAYRMCQQLAVNVSHDEGATWETRIVPDAKLHPYPTGSLDGILSIIGGENAINGEPITADKEGNLYAVWADAKNELYYASSKNQGLTWTKPVWAMAPGVQNVRMAAITAREPGEVAISYFGTTDGTKYDGYIAESKTGLDDEPTFWTVTVNDPADPLYPDTWQSGYEAIYFNNGGDEVTLIQIKYAPSGDLWASFVKDMCPKGDLNKCTWDYEAEDNSRFQGAVGRLVHR
ncbi:MAG: hypothetical protein QM778_39020 [Myxococcales bacterium]